MALEMVLNELSLCVPAANISTARQRMSDFIRTVRGVKAQCGRQATLRTQYDFYTTTLASDYPLRHWLNDSEVDREEQRFIKTLATKAPFSNEIANLEIQDIENNLSNCEFRHQGELAIGLGVAYLLDALSVSFLFEPRWDCSRLDLTLTQFENEELIEEHLEIIHASRQHHVQEHAECIKKKNRRHAEELDGSDLWNRRDELFPSLEFCENVSQQIQSLSTSNPMLRQVVKRLFELEDYCKSWTSGAFNRDNLPSKATPESETRLQQFRQQLTFICSDGEKRIFSLHVRMTPGAWRLHFSVELGPGKIIIGYIGSKIQ
ncbi:hypothetical protein [Coleofasciculus sp. FACHB-SPT9]|uniref:hypothetical protein n=1 Tax=Cyanophyceae TaxID=3028117 RepID=UPI00168694A9|nr:hypothetical protein [Coleofasciculus sp. FACHB-SPT9]MBD1892251.1 hypothetical protein [Coleofasciculus sp. FACHB-SPT9]